MGPCLQSGAVTILVVLMLMIVMSVLALTTGKVVFVEQETVGADLRTQEASETASAGLEYALAWLDDGNDCVNCVEGTTLNFEGSTVANAAIPNITYADSGYAYNPSVSLTKTEDYLLVSSSLDTVAGNTESGQTITGSEQVYVTLWNRYLTGDGVNAPPMVINGCLVNPVGTPDLFPSPEGPAILSLVTSTPVDWTHADAPDEPTSCISPNGHMSVQLCDGAACGPDDKLGDEITDNNELQDHLVGEDLTLEPYPQAWNYLFKITLSEAKQLALAAGQTSSSDGDLGLMPVDKNYMPFIHYTGSVPISTDFGTPDYPVALIVSDASCPHFNAGNTIYGILYYEAPDGDCNGFGGAEVIGSVVFEGDVEDLNANTGFFDSDNLVTGPGSDDDPLFGKEVARIPGTWKDW